MAGNAYAEYALFERHLARHRVEAATFCEVWYLPSKSFKAALAKHFSKLVYASLLLQQFGMKSLPSSDDRGLNLHNDDDERVDSVTSMKAQARQSKVLGHGSLLLQAVEARKLRAAAAAIAATTTAPNADRILSGSVAQLILSSCRSGGCPLHGLGGAGHLQSASCCCTSSERCRITLPSSAVLGY